MVQCIVSDEEEKERRNKGGNVPFEDFLPQPSLSITSSRQTTRWVLRGPPRRRRTPPWGATRVGEREPPGWGASRG